MATGSKKLSLGWVGLMEILCALILFAQGAHAGNAIHLKQILPNGDGEFELVFDKKIARNQVRVEFVNENIQLVFSDTEVYPAKIASYKAGPVNKVFAYQYAPNIVRARFTVKDKAEKFKDSFSYKAGGVGSKRLFVSLHGTPKMHTVEKAAAPTPETVAPIAMTQEEKSLLDRIQSGAPSAPAAAPATETKDQIRTTQAQPQRKAAPTSEPLGTSKPGPVISIGKTVAKLLFVIAMFVLCAVGVKKVFARFGGGKGMVATAVAKVLKVKPGQKQKMVEVISSHYLGPKKTISIVRVAGRTLVLGVTDESINLITQIDGEEVSDLSEISEQLHFSNKKPTPTAYAKPQAPGPSEPSVFSAVLASEQQAPRTNSGFRTQLRSKMEGFKPL